MYGNEKGHVLIGFLNIQVAPNYLENLQRLSYSSNGTGFEVSLHEVCSLR
jgi:hypothetical protein